MISGQKIGKGAIEYYLSYVRKGGPSRWAGEGASSLGLEGSISPEAFAALSEGKSPGGERLLERVSSKRTPGWDFTFSAPKSVSLSWALAKPELRRRIEAVHDGAVDSALSFLEDAGGRARRGLGGRDGHVEASLVVGCFTHPASREADPQLHTHAIILNAGFGADGRWSAIDSRTLYLHRRAAASIYRAELRSRIAELGGLWNPPDRRGLSELAGFEADVLRAFSRRRNQIEEALSSSGFHSTRAAQAACLSTRRAKGDVELAELGAEWRERAAELSLNRERVSRLLDGTDRREHLSQEERDLEEERLLGPSGLTKEHAAFRRDDVVVAWAQCLPQGASRKQLEELVDQTLHRPQVVPLVVADCDGTPLTTSRPHRSGVIRLVRSNGSNGPLVAEPRYSTTEMLALEARIFSLTDKGVDAGIALCPELVLKEVLANRSHLSSEQAEMVALICSSGNAVDVVVGVPGSGKTFALEAARTAWSACGYEVYGVALAAEAAAQLEAGSGIPSSTIDSFFLCTQLREPLGPSSVVVCDEAGMLDTRRMARLLELAASSGAKVVLTGDDRQLPAVEAGGAFAALARRGGALRLMENRRQVNEWEREALGAIRDGRASEAAAAYLGAGRVHHSDNPAELLAEMIKRWWEARQGGDEVALFSYSRDAARLLNSMARERLEAAGELEGDSVVAPEQPGRDLAPRTYKTGDEVVCLRNRRRLGASRDPSGKGVRNGSRGVVRQVDVEHGEIALELSDGRQLSLPNDYVVSYTDYGYALTLHKGQGRTVGSSAHSLNDNGAERRKGVAFVYGVETLSSEAALVAASRATDSTELFLLRPEEVDTEGILPLLEGAFWRECAKATAMEELEAEGRIAELSLQEASRLAETRRALVSLLTDGSGDAKKEDASIAAVRRTPSHRQGGGAASNPSRPSSESRDTHLAIVRDDRDSVYSDGNPHQGLDLPSARRELEVVDAAFATRRARHLLELSRHPPSYATGVLGHPPPDWPRSLRWRQGLAAIEDHRRSSAFVPPALTASSLEQALGSKPEDPLEARRWDRAAATLAEIKRDVETSTTRRVVVGYERESLSARPPNPLLSARHGAPATRRT